ncbi:MAG: HAD family hydrolase [Verrucomicrobiota bacterium]
MKPRYKHAIWDWNGTLLNDTWLCIDVLNDLLAKRGREPISEIDYRENFGFPVIRFYQYLGFDVDIDSFEKISREFISAYESRWLHECVLHSQVNETLSQLKGLGMSHSVLSAAKQEALESGIVHYGLDNHFLGLSGADDIYASGKVDQGLNWISKLECKPDEIVMIGDTLHDFEVAQAIGSDCILMSYGHHTPERLEQTGAPVIHSLKELVQELNCE